MERKIELEELVLISTTESTYSKAIKLAELLLNKKLVCCVNLHKIESLYWWEGSICQSEEVKLSIKTRKENSNKIFDIIEKESSYDVPEIISSNVSTSLKYSQWAFSVMN